jgi:hypothetical protein
MQFLDNISREAQSYWKEVPKNTGNQMVMALGAAFVIETIFTGSPQKGVVAAALSALATAIHGLISPLFKRVIGQQQLTWGQEMCRTFMAIITAGCIASAYGNNSILNGLFILSVIHGFASYKDASRRNLNQADWIVVFPSYTQPR